jgi:hypothetical protein
MAASVRQRGLKRNARKLNYFCIRSESMVNAIINGDHARLKCYENHKGCTALGPGTYDAEIEKDSVWILITKPVTHELASLRAF